MTADRLRRSAVHAAAASPRGASHPRQEGPPDFRLVPPALAAWFAAAAAPALSSAAVTWVCVAAVLLAVALLAVPGRRRRLRAAMATALLCAAAAAAVAALHTADSHRGPLPGLVGQHAHATIELTVTADPSMVRPHVRGAARAPATVLVEAEAHRVTVDGTTTAVRAPVLLIANRPAAPWQRLLPSTHLTVRALLAPPSRPGDRFAAVLSAHGLPQVTGEPTAAQRAAAQLRAGLRTATDGLAPDARALLPGLVVGDTSRITPELHDAFEATDLTHLTAVSGGNLAIILMLLIGPPGIAIHAERRGLAPRLAIPLRLTAVLGGLLTLAFVIVCRPDPSVLRAAACGLITLLAIGTGRRRTLVPALAAAVILLLLYDPWLARSYGFLLSVLATGALLTLAPRWSAALQRRRVPARLAEVLAAAAAAQAVCAPVVAVLAAHVSLVAVPCNLLAELAVAPATVLGFGALAAAPLAMPLAEALAWAGGWPAGWIAAVARRGAALPGATIDWPGTWPGALLLAALTATAVLLGRRLAHRPWLCGAVVLLMVLALLRHDSLPRTVTGWPPRDWRMVACDVGQGDALALAAGPGTAIVVDTGPDPALADRCLSDLGVTTVPLLVLTHFHADHVDGLPGVLRGRAVGAIETTILDEPAEEAAYVRRQAAAARIPVVRAAAGERRRLGPLDWQVLWPPAATTALPDDGPNDASVTLLVHTSGLTILLLGDLEPPAQRSLLSVAPDLPRVDVLKVAHHGSAYQDPTLLTRLHPRLAVISSGVGNPYGHPSPHTVTALRAQGATVLRTDTEGPIAVTGDAQHLSASVTGRTRPPSAHAQGGAVIRSADQARSRPRRTDAARSFVSSVRPTGWCGAGDRVNHAEYPPCRGMEVMPVLREPIAWRKHAERRSPAREARYGSCRRGGRPRHDGRRCRRRRRWCRRRPGSRDAADRVIGPGTRHQVHPDRRAVHGRPAGRVRTAGGLRPARRPVGAVGPGPCRGRGQLVLVPAHRQRGHLRVLDGQHRSRPGRGEPAGHPLDRLLAHRAVPVAGRKVRGSGRGSTEASRRSEHRRRRYGGRNRHRAGAAYPVDGRSSPGPRARALIMGGLRPGRSVAPVPWGPPPPGAGGAGRGAVSRHASTPFVPSAVPSRSSAQMVLPDGWRGSVPHLSASASTINRPRPLSPVAPDSPCPAGSVGHLSPRASATSTRSVGPSVIVRRSRKSRPGSRPCRAAFAASSATMSAAVPDASVSDGQPQAAS